MEVEEEAEPAELSKASCPKSQFSYLAIDTGFRFVF